jgi:type I site-specific restriction endonuclease
VWAVQDKDAINLHAGEGQAVREYVTDTGPADYVLFVDKKPIGVIEAKKETLGHNITTVEEQTAEYGSAKLKGIQHSGKPLPFSETVRRNFQTWIMRRNAGVPTEKKFTETQTALLQLIRDHVMTSFRFERYDLDYAPFDAQGGLGKMLQLFGDAMDELIEELNGEPAA